MKPNKQGFRPKLGWAPLRLLRVGLVGLLFPLFASCSAPSSHPESSSVAAWSLGDPVLTLGSLEGDVDAFSPIRSLAVGPEGRLFILLSQEHRVAVFTADGSKVGSIGREGEGPGEFTFPWDLGFLGDTLWVLDPGAQRVNFFVGLEFVGSRPLEVPRDLHPERRARAVAVLEGGRGLYVTDSQTPYDPAVTSTPSLILTQRLGSLDTLATYSTDHTAGFIIQRTGGQISAVRPFPQPIGGGDPWAFSPDGAKVVLVKPDPLQPHQQTSYFSVTMFRASGDTVILARVPFEPIKIPQEVVEEAVNRIANENFTAEEVREAAYLPETYPPVSAALIADDGSVWIGREAIPNSPRQWNVLSLGGELIASVTMPLGFEPRAVARDHVWGIVLDEFDVPYVLRRPIVRP